MEGIVLGRVGHYFNSGNGSCSTAIVAEVTTDNDGTLVNLGAWQHGGEPFSRTGVPVNPNPDTQDTLSSFHLTRECPWAR